MAGPRGRGAVLPLAPDARRDDVAVDSNPTRNPMSQSLRSRPAVAALAALAALVALAAAPSSTERRHTLGAQQAAPAATIAARTAGMERRDGFIPLWINERTGGLLLELPADGTRALFMTTLATGLGSNPIGLDRGSGGTVRVARFQKAGDRVLLTFENTSYRSSGSADNQRSVAEAFASSTSAALPILAEEGGKLLVDATDLVMRD